MKTPPTNLNRNKDGVFALFVLVLLCVGSVASAAFTNDSGKDKSTVKESPTTMENTPCDPPPSPTPQE